MKLRITAYDKDNNVLFLNDNFDGEVFYNGLPNTLGIDYGFVRRGSLITDLQKKKMLYDRRLSSDLQYLIKLTLSECTIIKGRSRILELLDMISALHYGNLGDINSFFKSQSVNCRKAERLMFEKII